MILSINSNYFSSERILQEGYIPAFDSNTHELTVVSSDYQGPLSTDLEEIAQHVNNLAKPIFRSTNQFYRLFLNIEKINDIIREQNGSSLIDTGSFISSLRPSANELKERLWAVHVSDHLWTDAVIKPFLKSMLTQEKGTDISLTVHFSLGEMVRPHDKFFNWKYRNFALLTPLGELTDQLAGIYPYDSFIHGEWKISPKAILVVPRETKVPEIYSQLGIKIVTYDPSSTSLRKTIKKQIVDAQGIFLKMSRHLVRPGSPAYLYGDKRINVNNIEFFEALTEESENLSVGLDICSLNHRLGYCFGIIRQMSSALSKSDRAHLDESQLQNHYFYLQFVYEKIKSQLTTEEQEQITNFLDEHSHYADFNTGSIKYPAISILCNLDFNEFQEFKLKHPLFFSRYTDFIIDAHWALGRWLMLGQKQGAKEGLEEIYTSNLNKFLESQSILLNSEIIDDLAKNLEGQSERAELALHILNLPETRTYNFRVAAQFAAEKAGNVQLMSKSYSFFSTDYEATSIESVLSVYSKTIDLFSDNYILPTIDVFKSFREKTFLFDEISEEKLELLTKILPIKIETDLSILKSSYSNIVHAIAFTPNSNTEKELYKIKIKDLQSLPNSILIYWKYNPIEKLWRKFNLEKEFNDLFPNKDLFWNSEETFVEIYRKLKQMREEPAS